MMRVEGACASDGLAMSCGVDALRAGADVVLVAGVEVQTGSAAAMLCAHETDITGRIPVNTGGRLVSSGHPVGATSVKQVVELWRQMKGKCSAYQMQKIPQIGVCANIGR
jgi:acetyl-CoA acetyltransferase